MVKRRNQSKIVFQIFYGKIQGTVYDFSGELKNSTAHFLENYQQLDAALETLCEELEFNGLYAEFIFQGEESQFRKFDFPTMGKKDFQLVLQRKAKVEWERRESYSFSYSLQKSKLPDFQECLLFMVSTNIQQSCLSFCRNVKIVPLRFVTLGAIGSAFAKKFGKDEASLLVFQLHDRVCLLGVAESKQLILRTIACDLQKGEEEASHLSREIHRTQLFVKQQFGVNPKNILLFGPEFNEVHPKVVESLEEEVIHFSEEISWEYWLQKVPIDGSENILPKTIIQKRKMVHKARIVTLVNIGFVIASVFSYWGMNYLIQDTEKLIEKLLLEEGQSMLELEESVLMQRQKQIFENYAKADLKNSKTNEPTPGWVVQKLPTWVPDSLVITQFDMKRADTNWSVLIQGKGPRHATGSSRWLNEFCQNLERGLEDWEMDVHWNQKWLQTLSKGGTLQEEGITRRFELSGVLE